MGKDFVQRAFADDVGVVLHDTSKQLPHLKTILGEFGEISNIIINLDKTVGIPLWPRREQSPEELVAAAVPEWSRIPIQYAALYLGCWIGPEKCGQEWRKAEGRFRERMLAWEWAGLGLHFATAVYNTYALPTLGFTAQVAEPNEEILRVEAWALQRATPGPNTWATKEDLWHLAEDFGMPNSFGSLAAVAQAAKVRLEVCDNFENGGLRVGHIVNTVQQHMRSLAFPTRVLWLSVFWDDSIPAVLARNTERMKAKGINGRSILAQLQSQERAAGWSEPDVTRRARKKVQKTVRKALMEKEAHEAESRIRYKLSRWKLPGMPRTNAVRMQKNLQLLSGLVPPRVCAAVFGTAWNRWCTRRRFQQRASSSNICKFGCSLSAEDSLEHYSRCRVVRECHRCELGLSSGWLLPEWIGTHSINREDRDRSLWAVGAYATYKVYNAARHAGGFAEEVTMDAFRLAVMDVISGSPRLTQWMMERPGGPPERSVQPDGSQRRAEQELSGEQEAQSNRRRRLTIREAFALWDHATEETSSTYGGMAEAPR